MIPTTISSGTRPPLAMMSLALQADRRLRRHRRAQHVAGRELDDAVALNQPLRLGSLARPRRPRRISLMLFAPRLGERTTAHLVLEFRPSSRSTPPIQRRRPLSFDFLISPSY